MAFGRMSLLAEFFAQRELPSFDLPSATQSIRTQGGITEWSLSRHMLQRAYIVVGWIEDDE